MDGGGSKAKKVEDKIIEGRNTETGLRRGREREVKIKDRHRSLRGSVFGRVAGFWMENCGPPGQLL